MLSHLEWSEKFENSDKKLQTDVGIQTIFNKQMIIGFLYEKVIVYALLFQVWLMYVISFKIDKAREVKFYNHFNKHFSVFKCVPRKTFNFIKSPNQWFKVQEKLNKNLEFLS